MRRKKALKRADAHSRGKDGRLPAPQGPGAADDPLYIFDVDRTLALIEHRRHLVERARCTTCDGMTLLEPMDPAAEIKRVCTD